MGNKELQNRWTYAPTTKRTKGLNCFTSSLPKHVFLRGYISLVHFHIQRTQKSE